MARKKPAPRWVPSVTISSTFEDLKTHRAALIKAIRAHRLAEVAMENDSAKLTDVIESSLQMVRDGSAYIGIIGLRYGEPPRSASRNPKELSLTELEFDEAVALDRPILLFVMADDHRGGRDDFERDPARLEKLNAFRERAKRSSDVDGVHRVFAEFSSLAQFKDKIGPSLAELRRHLDAQDGPILVSDTPPPAKGEPIPVPPAFYAEPDYIVSNRFIGREAQLQDLSDWAKPAVPHPVLLFDAIGGNGKSMLTWEWTTRYAAKAPWAGRFWYSFYEKGAIMADFCQRALAYITGQPLESLRRRKTRELTKELLAELHARPWLIVLDGLERVLVAYHRFDASEVPDEEAPTDKIINRDPCAAIRDEDDDLLRMLAAAAPSKILITSRLVPRVFLNAAGSTILGVRRISLPGLRPPDAEALLRSYGISGRAEEIQNYLSINCDCHPLVTGVLAGLINDYLPDKGNFDAWVADPSGGGLLNLADLDLVQRRNHILLAAIAALAPKSAELLGTIALIPEAIDYPTLAALNPHLPEELEEVEKPEPPEEHWRWEELSDDDKDLMRNDYDWELARWTAYEQAVNARLQSEAYRAAPALLTRTVSDLQRRGLLQYDGASRRYDLHPVVRAVAAGELQAKQREKYGLRVVDHFSRQSHNPYESAETRDDVRHGLTVVRTLTKIGRLEQASDAYSSGLATALLFNLEDYHEILSLLRPLFPLGWDFLPEAQDDDRAYLANDIGIALYCLGLAEDALKVLGASLSHHLKRKKWNQVCGNLRNFYNVLIRQNQIARGERIASLTLRLALAAKLEKSSIFLSRQKCFYHYSLTGRWKEAEDCWPLLDTMGRAWPRHAYRSGDAELDFVRYNFWRGSLTQAHLENADRLMRADRNRFGIRLLDVVRGTWLMEKSDWIGAEQVFNEAVRLAREKNILDAEAETGLVLAKLHLGHLADPAREAERLRQGDCYRSYLLAKLHLAIGEQKLAADYALKDYERAWADGEPHVRRYELTRDAALLEELGVPIPDLPPFDLAKITPFPWEAEVEAAIEQLRAENAESAKE